jgi:metal-sulfur cluster biosynthetic enzyme
MAATTLTAEEVLESLTRVIDPAFGINIYDLGLVYGIDVAHGDVTIEMTLTSPDTPSRATIETQIRDILQRRHPELAGIDIQYVWEPPWRDDFITDDGRRQLESPIILQASPDTAPITEDDVYDALMLVLDPEVGINIVDLGLIYDVTTADNAVQIVMTLTTPGCPLHASIEAAVRRTLETRHPAVHDVKLELVWEPPWDTERITASGREQLGW